LGARRLPPSAGLGGGGAGNRTCGEAFREEREYRLLATSRTNDEPASRDYLRHRAAGERLIAYAALGLGEATTPSISEVVLGPKHTTPPEVVEEFLELNGFPDLAVRKSVASYR
jgi:hypothetical protein